MIGSVTALPSGTWFRYPSQAARIRAHAPKPGAGGVTVLWRGRTQIDDLGVFFENAAWKVQSPPPTAYRVWLLDGKGAHPFLVPHVVPLPSSIAAPHFVRFECVQPAETGDLPLIVWINLDTEVDPDQEAIGVYLRQTDIGTLREEITRAIVGTIIGPGTPPMAVSPLEQDVRDTLWNLESDLKEASQQQAAP